MKLHRFFISNPLTPSADISDPVLLHQIFRVLKLKAGERLVLCDGQGKEATYELARVSKDVCRVRRVGNVTSVPEPKRKVHLYCAVLKKENFEWVVEKAVEVGASFITPIISRRTVKQNLKRERMKMIAKEAAEQSGRGAIPEVGETLTFQEALREGGKCDVHIFCDFSGESFPSLSSRGSFAVYVGPEGGWGSDEMTLAKEAGCGVASLGKFTLRSETAAVVGVFMAINS